MKRPILVVMLCLACSHCRLTGLEELGEEKILFNTGHAQEYVELTGKDQILVVPSIGPLTGGKALPKYLTWVRAKGIQRFNATLIKEMDLGEYYLEIASYTCYDGNDRMSDEGTFLKFYKRTSGKLTMLVNTLSSSLTP